MATLEDLEARVTALEASQADYRAVLAAVNALGANQREHSIRLDELKTEVADGFRVVDAQFRVVDVRFRSVDEQLAEIKDLIVGRRDGSL
jgi:ABC-type transporter Mla subunit MlaD